VTADLLREAAALMRERAEKATTGPWEFRPRRGFESVNDAPATIGFKDTSGYFVMLREGTWGTQGDMGYVASWHPAVALAVADWLDAAYADWHHSEHSLGAMSIRSMSGQPNLPDGMALAVAHAYLGRDA